MLETAAALQDPGLRGLLQLGRVAFLTNFIPPYRKPVLTALARRCSELRTFVSTPMESNRAWAIDWHGLDVRLQKTISFAQKWKHPDAGVEAVHVHIPIDTLQCLHSYRPDVVISAELGMRSVFAAVHRRLSPRATFLIWADIAESTEKGRGFSRALLRRILKTQTDGFIVNGASGARYLRRLGVPEQKLHVVPYATDVERFGSVLPEMGDSPTRRLLYVGQLIERKGLLPFINVLIEWARKHREQQVEFTLVGKGPLRELLQAVPTPPNLSLTLRGNVEYDCLPWIYAKAELFVLPALADTWALVVNEAMAAGLPVLGSLHAQAVDELVAEGRSGWRFDSASLDSIYAAIDRCMVTPPAELAKMRAAARDTALALTPEYTAERIVRACADSARSKG